MSAIAGNGLGCHSNTQAPRSLDAVAPAHEQEATLRNWMHAAGATAIVVILQLALRAMLMLRKWNY